VSIRRRLGRAGRVEGLSVLGRVWFAASPLLRCLTGPGFAPEAVTSGPGELAASTTKNGDAPTAVAPSRSIATRRPEPVPVSVVAGWLGLEDHEPVYDLTVADAHEFLAAGVIVHNCYLIQALKPATAKVQTGTDTSLYRNARGRARKKRRSRPNGPRNPYARGQKKPINRRGPS
jgi:hypothetical protein